MEVLPVLGYSRTGGRQAPVQEEGSVEMPGRLAFLPVSSEGKASVRRASKDLGIS